LITDFSFTHEQAAGAVGRSRSAVSNLLRLLNLAKPVQTMLMAGDIDMGHARALLSAEAAMQITLANQIVAKRMSVREAEKLVTHNISGQSSVKKQRLGREKTRDIESLEEELSDLLATQVSIKLGAKSNGQLVIDFANLDLLDTVIAKLRA
jgi:ParB family chromosome partitioning protein